MKKITLLISFALLTLTFSCKEKPKNEEPSQMLQVMAVHDEVMPKMSTIGKLIGQIDDKINKEGSSEALVNAKQELKDSNKAMMDWMRGFGDRFDTDEIMKGKALTDEKKKFLDEEEIKVNALRDKMNSSIQNAEAILK
ncbi:hypothetical protein H0I23_12630 [Cellulophaga sp. HaHaR_3_176]|uniref:hypothetical protein n=1 Tax=Cellulophaga sp. HaHaR_3_176 TaxID=1942464 RepID=UPI001C1F979E|nr:hypothetical protein [Cellulophaga sp. HaHaR_3_176]QWX83292.1 hypothetical protein H0I23_12630 [Cellulophaga sp. HaHaR_3_176]